MKKKIKRYAVVFLVNHLGYEYEKEFELDNTDYLDVKREIECLKGNFHKDSVVSVMDVKRVA